MKTGLGLLLQMARRRRPRTWLSSMLNPSGVLSYGKTHKGCVTMEFSHSFLSFRHFLISRLVWMFKFALAGQGREVANT